MRTKNPINFDLLVLVFILPLIASCDSLIRATMLPKSENELHEGRKYIGAGNCAKGLEYLNKAFKDGGPGERYRWDAYAAVELGYLYQNGKCVTQNTATARSWFEQAVAINGNRNGAENALARLNGSSLRHTDDSTDQQTSEYAQNTYPFGERVRSMVETCSGGGNIPPSVQIAGHGPAHIVNGDDGSVTIMFDFQAKAVAAALGLHSIEGNFGVKISNGDQSMVMSGDMVDGNEFSIDLSPVDMNMSGGSTTGTLSLRFPASVHLKITYGVGPSGVKNLMFPTIYLTKGACTAG
jgi:hypothetical protein